MINLNKRRKLLHSLFYVKRREMKKGEKDTRKGKRDKKEKERKRKRETEREGRE